MPGELYTEEELGDDYNKLMDNPILTADLTDALNGKEGRKHADDYVCNVVESSMFTLNKHHGIDG